MEEVEAEGEAYHLTLAQPFSTRVQDRQFRGFGTPCSWRNVYTNKSPYQCYMSRGHVLRRCCGNVSSVHTNVPRRTRHHPTETRRSTNNRDTPSRRVDHSAQTTRFALDEDYMLLLWHEQHPKRICDVFWLKYSDRYVQSAYLRILHVRHLFEGSRQCSTRDFARLCQSVPALK